MAARIKQKKSGKWILAVSSYDNYGMQHWKYKTVDVATRREAEQEWTKFAAEYQQKTKSTTLAHMDKINLSDFRHYRNTQTGRKVSAKTQDTEDYLFAYIEPAIAHIAMSKIKPYHIAHVLGEVSREDISTRGTALSAETQLKIFKLMKQLFTAAHGLEIINSNPFNSPALKAPRVEQKDKVIYNDDELCEFLEALQVVDIKRRLQISLLIGCGLRREELLGLQYKDIDKDYTTISVERAVIKRFKHEKVDETTNLTVKTAPLKTKNARRIVDIPSSVAALLKQYRALHGTSLPWLFRDHPDSLYTWLDRFCRRHGFRHISPHTLRHMHITYKHYAGIPIAEISRDAGHGNKAFTMRQYVGLVEQRSRAGADALDLKLNINKQA